MARRSVLGPLLPESMICLLERRGPERFAEVFCGSVDTPEVIWNPSMRAHLVKMLRQHVHPVREMLAENHAVR